MSSRVVGRFPSRTTAPAVCGHGVVFSAMIRSVSSWQVRIGAGFGMRMTWSSMVFWSMMKLRRSPLPGAIRFRSDGVGVGTMLRERNKTRLVVWCFWYELIFRCVGLRVYVFFVCSRVDRGASSPRFDVKIDYGVSPYKLIALPVVDRQICPGR